jgi:hypothetical protein
MTIKIPTTDRGSEIKEVEAEPIEIPGWAEHQFVVHASISKKGAKTVTHLPTGRSVTDCDYDDIESVRFAAEIRLTIIRKADFEKLIAKFPILNQ